MLTLTKLKITWQKQVKQRHDLLKLVILADITAIIREATMYIEMYVVLQGSFLLRMYTRDYHVNTTFCKEADGETKKQE